MPRYHQAEVRNVSCNGDKDEAGQLRALSMTLVCADKGHQTDKGGGGRARGSARRPHESAQQAQNPGTSKPGDARQTKCLVGLLPDNRWQPLGREIRCCGKWCPGIRQAETPAIQEEGAYFQVQPWARVTDRAHA
jgi:hypothetical protein